MCFDPFSSASHKVARQPSEGKFSFSLRIHECLFSSHDPLTYLHPGFLFLHFPSLYPSLTRPPTIFPAAHFFPSLSNVPAAMTSSSNHRQETQKDKAINKKLRAIQKWHEEQRHRDRDDAFLSFHSCQHTLMSSSPFCEKWQLSRKIYEPLNFCTVP